MLESIYIFQREESRMKATGIVRKLDELGRIVLPVETRRMLDIKTKDPVELYTEGEMIILKKWTPVCMFCGGTNDVGEYGGKYICKSCCEKIGKEFAE